MRLFIRQRTNVLKRLKKATTKSFKLLKKILKMRKISRENRAEKYKRRSRIGKWDR